MKVYLFILFTFLYFLVPAKGDDGRSAPEPTEYSSTLSDHSQGNILHCTSLHPTHRLLCELEGAIDAQAHAATHLPPHPPLPCKFKQQNVYNLYPYAIPSPPALNRVLHKYAAMHRRCMASDRANLSDAYSSFSKAPTCKYLIFRPTLSYGLGNRLLALISSFLYAILSARVLVVDYPQWWAQLFCEPFSGSSIFHVPSQTALRQHLGLIYTAFRNARCGRSGVANASRSICNTTVVNLVFHHKVSKNEYESLACPMGCARLRNVAFVTLREGNQYLVPAFYTNPVLSPLLDALFPQRNPFHLLSRSLLMPSDDMWKKISSNVDVHARMRIGVQIREFNHQYTPEYDTNIFRCILKKGGFLPGRFRKRPPESTVASTRPATLVKRHLNHVEEKLWFLRGSIGKEFRFHYQRLDGREGHDTKHQKEAMVDMWVLSLSHVLITSKMSTFGYIASGLSGVTPYFLEKDPLKACSLGLGLDPCLHNAPKGLWCTQDEPVRFSLHHMVQKYGKVKVCKDRPSGWTLVQ